MKKLLTFLTTIILLFGISGCAAPKQYDIYTTIYPLNYIINSLVKDELTVNLVPGVNSHSSSIDWSASDIYSMTNAKLLIYTGSELDTYIDQQKVILTEKGLTLFKLTDHMSLLESCYSHDHFGHSHSGEASEDADQHDEDDDACSTKYKDPHFFLSPKRMIEATELIYQVIKANFPDLLKLEKNKELLLGNLTSLDSELKEIIVDGHRPMLATSNLYSYLSYDYGLDVISISESAHDENDTISDIKTFVDEALLHQIKYVVFEINTKSNSGEMIFAEINKTYECGKLEFHSLELLTSENIEKNETYIAVMKKNIEVIKTVIE